VRRVIVFPGCLDVLPALGRMLDIRADSRA